jgi:hypothetical protein
MRTYTGKACELVKTSKTSPTGTWYYRLWYGTVLGTRLWTLQELKDSVVKRWFKRCPKGLVSRKEAS